MTRMAMDLSRELRPFFTEKALSALDRAVVQGAPDRPASTLDVFLAVMEVDALAAWWRIYPSFREPEAPDAARYQDPQPHADDWWNGRPITVTCACAIRASVGLACNTVPNLVPISVGVLALCLVGLPATAASRALGVRSDDAHRELLELVQEALVQGHWDDIQELLGACYAVPDPPAPGEPGAPGLPAPGWLDADDADLRRMLDVTADRIEALIDALNQFLRADSPERAGELIEQHPELLSSPFGKIIEDAIRAAEQAGDREWALQMQVRCHFRQSYRQLIDGPPETIAGTERLADRDRVPDAAAVAAPGERAAPGRPGQPGTRTAGSRLEERLRQLQSTPEPDVIRATDALAEAAELLAAADDLRTDERLLMMVGGLHFMRWCADQDDGASTDHQEELMVAMALLAPLYAGSSSLLDRRLRRFLHRERGRRPRPDEHPASTALRAFLRAARPADHEWAELLWQVSHLVYRGYRRTDQGPALSEATALLGHAVTATPVNDPDYPRRAATLGAWRLVRQRETSQPADLADALGRLRAGTAGLPAHSSGLPGALSALGSALDSLFEQEHDLDALDAGIRAHREALRNLPEDGPRYGALALRLAAALLRYHGRTRQRPSLEEAITILRKAETAADRHGERSPGVLIGLANNLGVAYTARYERTRDGADLDEAINAGERAVGIADDAGAGVDERDRAAACGTLGMALIERYVRYANGRPADFLPPDDANRMLGQLLDEALGHLREAVTRSPGGSPAYATAQANLGIGLLRAREAGTPRDVVDEARAAFSAAADSRAAAAPVRLLASLTAGRLTADHGDWQAAAARLEAAIDLLATAVPRGLRREDREYQLSLLRDLGCDAAACAWQAGDAARAVRLFERGRGVLLAQEIGTPTELDRLRACDHAGAEKLARDFAALQHEVDKAERGELVSDPGDWGKPTAAEERRRLRGQREELLGQIRAIKGFEEFGRPTGQVDPRAVSDGGPVVLLNVSRYGSAAFLIRDAAVAVKVLPRLTPAMVRAMLAELLIVTDRDKTGQLAAQPRLDHLLGSLWDTAVGPVLDELGITARLDPAKEAAGPRVWWCPGGLLSFLPLHAAGHHATRSDAIPRTAIDRVISSYTPTLRVLERSRRAPAVADGQLLIVDPGTLGAEKVRREAAWRKREGVKLLADAAATRGAVRSGLELREYRRVHFDGHAVSELSNPSGSRLELYGEERLPLTDVIALRLDHADFAFLAACSTYQGGTMLADEAIHLGGAFQLAGYRHVVGTLWPVKSTPTADRIAAVVHQAIAGSEGVAATPAALHRATRQQRDAAPGMPSLWAPYVHGGS